MTQKVSDEILAEMLERAEQRYCCDDPLIAAFRELIELRAQNKWVKVTPETMPRLDGVLVLVQYSDGSIGFDSTVEISDRLWDWEKADNVTRYCAIPPAPPEAE